MQPHATLVGGLRVRVASTGLPQEEKVETGNRSRGWPGPHGSRAYREVFTACLAVLARMPSIRDVAEFQG